MVLMPSCTVPMFSNRLATSHRIQLDMKRMRITRAMATAMTPSDTASRYQAPMAMAATPASSSELSRVRLTVRPVARRIWRCTVVMKPSMASRA